MIIYPQETWIKKNDQYDSIIKNLREELVLNRGISPVTDTDKTIYAVTSSTTIPAFNLPFNIPLANKSITVVDLRKLQREYTLKPDQTLEPYPNTESDFLIKLAVLQRLWIYSPGEFSRVYNQLGKIYAHWISGVLRSRLNLPVEDVSLISVLALYFFLTRTVRTTLPTTAEYVIRMKNIIVLDTHQTAAWLEHVNIKGMNTIEDLCRNIRELSVNPKLSNLTPLSLSSFMNGSWMGGNNPLEMMGVGIEYPPVFAGMVYRSINTRSFKDTLLTRTVTNLLRKGDSESFIRSMETLISSGSRVLI